jgi:hypothetical protein
MLFLRSCSVMEQWLCVCVCPHLYLCTRVILSQFVYRVSEPRLYDEGGVVSHTWVGPKLCAL